MLQTDGGFMIQNFNCTTLDEPLDFFSQVLSLEQLTEYGFQFLCGIFDIKLGAIYMLENDQYSLKYKVGECCYMPSHPRTKELKHIATLYGRTLEREFEQYFDESFIRCCKIKLVIPITVQDELKGFIVSSDNYEDGFTDEKRHFVESVKTLMNMAFQISYSYDAHKEMERSLDRKIYNLFFNNQSTRILLSELNLDNIYKLCIDVIRELTSSAVTTMALFDEVRNRVVTKGYIDIINFKSEYIELEIREPYKPSESIIYSVSEDKACLESLFVNPEEIYKLKGISHIVILGKEKLLGYIGVGDPLNGHAYDKEIFEQIESLATSMYLAVTNALQVKQMAVQAQRISDQLKRLEGINKAIRNINSCQDISEMSEIVLDTMVYAFNVERMVFCAQQKNEMVVLGTRGFETFPHKIAFIEEVGDQTTYCVGDELVERYFEPDLGKLLSNGSANIIAPVHLDVIDEQFGGNLAYLMIFDLNQPMREEAIMGITAIANSMAPLLKQFLLLDDMRNKMIENPEFLMCSKINQYEEEMRAYQLEYRVYYKKMEHQPFEEFDVSLFENFDYVCWDGYIYCFIYTEELMDESLFDGYFCGGSPTLIQKWESSTCV